MVAHTSPRTLYYAHGNEEAAIHPRHQSWRTQEEWGDQRHGKSKTSDGVDEKKKNLMVWRCVLERQWVGHKVLTAREREKNQNISGWTPSNLIWKHGN